MSYQTKRQIAEKILLEVLDNRTAYDIATRLKDIPLTKLDKMLYVQSSMYDYITPFLRMKNISHASDYIELAFLTIRVDDLRIVLGELFALYVEYVFSIRPFCFTKIENRDLNVDDRGEPLWKANIIKYPPVIGTSAINSP